MVSGGTQRRANDNGIRPRAVTVLTSLIGAVATLSLCRPAIIASNPRALEATSVFVRFGYTTRIEAARSSKIDPEQLTWDHES